MRTQYKRLNFSALAVAAVATSVGIGYACADTLDDDPLHGYVWSGNPLAPTNTDNGTISPFSSTSPNGWGFFVSPPSNQTGTLFFDVLIPNNLTPGSGFTFTGTLSGSTGANLGDWQTGNLQTFLNFPNASPNNPLNAWLASTQKSQPGANGYWVFQANMGSSVTLTGFASSTMVEYISSSLPEGALIVAFLEETTCKANICTTKTIDTAPSGALAEAPLPGALALFAPALGMGYCGLRLRRRSRRRLA